MSKELYIAVRFFSLDDRMRNFEKIDNKTKRIIKRDLDQKKTRGETCAKMGGNDSDLGRCVSRMS